MGHSASIAKKYSPSKESPRRNRATEAPTDDDEEQELASVASFRPNSPAAHSDARSFTLGTPRRQHREPVGYHGIRSPHHGNSALVPYVSREPSYATINGTIPSSVSQSSRFRSMRDVRDYIQSNPDLLVKKKHEKKEHKQVSGFDDILAPHKQIKTKQRVYLSLINQSPIIYAMGAHPDNRRLRVNQNVYLNLVYPTQDKLRYKEQAYRSRPPVQHNGMVVIRKDDYFKQQNGHVRWSKAPTSKAYPQQMSLPQLSQRSKTSSQNWDRTLALSKAPPRSRQPLPPPEKARQKQKSEHVLLPPASSKKRPQNLPSQSWNGQAGSQQSLTEKGNGVGVMQPGSGASLKSNMSRHRSNASEATVEFTFNLEDLNLKKKSEVAYSELGKDRGKVVPLYFRKSLAYSPKYIEDDGLLSSPL